MMLALSEVLKMQQLLCLPIGIVNVVQPLHMSAEQLATGEKEICTIYGEKQCTSVNQVRHRMFGTHRTPHTDRWLQTTTMSECTVQPITI